jgi:hypothetical protein
MSGTNLTSHRSHRILTGNFIIDNDDDLIHPTNYMLTAYDTSYIYVNDVLPMHEYISAAGFSLYSLPVEVIARSSLHGRTIVASSWLSAESLRPTSFTISSE